MLSDKWFYVLNNKGLTNVYITMMDIKYTWNIE